MGINLHPDADAAGAHACYPNCLPQKARRGLFGEVMAGMMTEAFRNIFVGGHPWRVPIFLFRNHADVEAYLYALARDDRRRREIFGRFGSDFIGIALDNAGEVARFIAGEAKWRQRLTDAVVEELMLGELIEDPVTHERVRSGKGVWFEINRDTPVPHGLRQLQRLLEDRDPDGHAAAILSLDRALIVDHPRPLPRTNPDRRGKLVTYARDQFSRGRGILWTSQLHGLDRLLRDASFALCTPTGSGKTLVANMALIKELLLLGHEGPAPLAMYLVPSRALAGEVEAKLRAELGDEIIVTGLYGGADWGITDYWLSGEEPAARSLSPGGSKAEQTPSR
jgi:hypothetical protein